MNKAIPTTEQYALAFKRECASAYPQVDDFERRLGYAIDRVNLECMARILACPVKANPPNWQHGRVIYAAVRRYLATLAQRIPVTLLDIGTAKGFSAIVMAQALCDAPHSGHVVSLDIVDPLARVARNSVAECTGLLLTVPEFVRHWPGHTRIEFAGGGALHWLARNVARINVAFVDGKHNYAAVSQEIAHIARVQHGGDVCIFDDVHLKPVRDAIVDFGRYDLEFLDVLPHRAYAVGVRV